MCDGVFFGFERFETLDSFFLPRCDPASERVSADAGDSRRVIACPFPRSFAPLPLAQFGHLLVTPLFGTGERGSDTTFGKSEVLGMLGSVANNSHGPARGFFRNVFHLAHADKIISPAGRVNMFMTQGSA